MPEVPDLIVVERTLRRSLEPLGTVEIRTASVREPIVIRMVASGRFTEALAGQRICGVRRHGPFLRLELQALDMVIHFMLAGRLSLAASGGKRPATACFSLLLEDGRTLHYADRKKMGRVYIVPAGVFDAIPGYQEQGIDIMSGEFTLPAFRRLIRGRRHQIRSFLMDQRILSAVGNAKKSASRSRIVVPVCIGSAGRDTT